MTEDEVMARIRAFCTPEFPAGSISNTLWKKACCHLLKQLDRINPDGC